MNKLDYLRKTFAHAKGKEFENYVINQIWAKVEEFGLYPVTQQYVKRPNGYALLDLYFPQIIFAIEVNENYHKRIIRTDEMRIEDIFGSIPEIDIVSIKEDNYENVKTQIKNTVNKIESKVKKLGPFSWEDNWKEKEYDNKISAARKKGKLNVSDSIGFKKIQVTNDIFNMDLSDGFLRYGNSFFKKSNNEYIWFPHLTKQKDWENNVSDDWNMISEKYIGKNNLPKLDEDKTLDKNILRHTFAKYKDSLGEISYRFIGIFKIKEVIDGTRIYERVHTDMIL
jgi:hypothetical protein